MSRDGEGPVQDDTQTLDLRWERVKVKNFLFCRARRVTIFIFAVLSFEIFYQPVHCVGTLKAMHLTFSCFKVTLLSFNLIYVSVLECRKIKVHRCFFLLMKMVFFIKAHSIIHFGTRNIYTILINKYNTEHCVFFWSWHLDDKSVVLCHVECWHKKTIIWWNDLLQHMTTGSSHTWHSWGDYWLNVPDANDAIYLDIEFSKP